MDELDRNLDEKSKVLLREEQTRLLKIVEAFQAISKSQEWQTLNEMIFSKSLASIEVQIKIESLKPVIDTNKLYKLQGEWGWARQYGDLPRFIEALKKQLEEIKKKLHE